MEKLELESYPKKCTVTSTKESKNLENRNEKGLTLWTAAFFILGEMAGSGVLALPNAVLSTTWIGLVMITVFCITSGFSGTRLSRCWIMLEDRYPEYRTQVRDPYPTIAHRAYGPFMRYVVSFCVDFTLFGVGTVFLLLSAQLLQHVATDSGILPSSMNVCIWTLIIALVLAPFMWLGTPKDFWPAAIGAAICTAIACVIVVFRCVQDAPSQDSVAYPPTNFKKFFLAFGTILFSYGGASTFPTIQNDMRDRSEFSKSVSIAFVGLLLFYLPVAICGYVFFGDKVEVNILDSFESGADVQIVRLLLAAHLFFAFIIIVNPFCQEIEEFFKIPNAFTWRRCVLRTAIMVLIVCVGETIPSFGKVLDFVGGSTITLMTFVFPPLFYLRLTSQKNSAWEEIRVPLWEKIVLWSLIAIGVLGGTASTYNGFMEIINPDAFSLPCYIAPPQMSNRTALH